MAAKRVCVHGTETEEPSIQCTSCGNMVCCKLRNKGVCCYQTRLDFWSKPLAELKNMGFTEAQITRKKSGAKRSVHRKSKERSTCLECGRTFLGEYELSRHVKKDHESGRKRQKADRTETLKQRAKKMRLAKAKKASFKKAQLAAARKLKPKKTEDIKDDVGAHASFGSVELSKSTCFVI